jgi:hypothetical protein
MDYNKNFREGRTRMQPRQSGQGRILQPQRESQIQVATLTHPRRGEKRSKRGRPEVTEIASTGRRLDRTTTSKTEDSGSRGTVTGTATGTDTAMADAADSSAETTTTLPASGVRRRRGREATADAGAPEAVASIRDPDSESKEKENSTLFY